jgi:folate-binding protein YgfZ
MPWTSSHSGVEISPTQSGSGENPASGNGVTDGFRALLSTAGAYDLASRTKILLTGRDRIRWLNGMVTNNIRDLAVGRGVYAFLLNPQGHILGDLYAFNRGEYLLVDIESSQLEKILATFDHYIIMDDVEVTNASDKLTAIGISGPKSGETLRSAGFALPDLEPLQLTDLVWQEVGVTLVRGEMEQSLSYQIWLAPANKDRLQDALVAAGAVPLGLEALELYRIALGIPRYGQDIRERDLPQETEQQRALNFNKGCYIGQEIVERIRSRGSVHRKFTGFEIAGALPSPGTRVLSQGKEIGEITSAASLPVHGEARLVALGYVRREAGNPGQEVEAGAARATVCNLPFAGLFSK